MYNKFCCTYISFTCAEFLTANFQSQGSADAMSDLWTPGQHDYQKGSPEPKSSLKYFETSTKIMLEVTKTYL